MHYNQIAKNQRQRENSLWETTCTQGSSIRLAISQQKPQKPECTRITYLSGDINFNQEFQSDKTILKKLRRIKKFPD